jgi:hypothetical protein
MAFEESAISRLRFSQRRLGGSLFSHIVELKNEAGVVMVVDVRQPNINRARPVAGEHSHFATESALPRGIGIDEEMHNVVPVFRVDNGDDRSTSDEASDNVEDIASGVIHLDDATTGIEPDTGHGARKKSLSAPTRLGRISQGSWRWLFIPLHTNDLISALHGRPEADWRIPDAESRAGSTVAQETMRS